MREVEEAVDIALFISKEMRAGNIPTAYAVSTPTGRPNIAMAALVSSVLFQHWTLFTETSNIIPPNFQGFEMIANCLFRNISWGSIVCMYAVSAKMATRVHDAEEFATQIGHFIGQKTEKWLKTNGGWKSLETVRNNVVASRCYNIGSLTDVIVRRDRIYFATSLCIAVGVILATLFVMRT